MYKSFKKLADFIVALGILILIFPIAVFISFLLVIDHKGNPFFIQIRVGYKEKMFKIIKFKTMNEKKNIDNKLLEDQSRLTRVGKFIRKTSLDEIPQLLNVIMGQMSIIGPRPLLPEYLSLYNKKQRKRHDVMPGITGLAQISGRNKITWQEKFELDIEYINNQNFLLDFKILIKTIGKVALAKEINSKNNLSMEPFNGKN